MVSPFCQGSIKIQSMNTGEKITGKFVAFRKPESLILQALTTLLARLKEYLMNFVEFT